MLKIPANKALTMLTTLNYYTNNIIELLNYHITTTIALMATETSLLASTPS